MSHYQKKGRPMSKGLLASIAVLMAGATAAFGQTPAAPATATGPVIASPVVASGPVAGSPILTTAPIEVPVMNGYPSGYPNGCMNGCAGRADDDRHRDRLPLVRTRGRFGLLDQGHAQLDADGHQRRAGYADRRDSRPRGRRRCRHDRDHGRLG